MGSLPNPTNPVVAQVLRQLVSDANFRSEFQSNPADTIARYAPGLTEQEQMRLVEGTQGLVALTKGMDEVDAAFFYFRSDAA